jgi:hypothetical protein
MMAYTLGRHRIDPFFETLQMSPFAYRQSLQPRPGFVPFRRGKADGRAKIWKVD